MESKDSKSETKPEDAPQEWYTPTEAARYLRLSRQTLYTYMEQGLLRYYELPSGGGRRLRRADLDGLLKPASGQGGSAGQGPSAE